MQNRYISARHPTLIGPAAEFDIALERGDMDTEKVREIVRNYISDTAPITLKATRTMLSTSNTFINIIANNGQINDILSV